MKIFVNFRLFRKLSSVIVFLMFVLVTVVILNVSIPAQRRNCRSVSGLSSLLKRGNVLLFGELHGTEQSPAFIEVNCKAYTFRPSSGKTVAEWFLVLTETPDAPFSGVYGVSQLTSSQPVKTQTVQTQKLEDLPNPFQVLVSNVQKNNYITPLVQLKANETKYLASPIWKETYLEMIILLEGFVGNYAEALRYEDQLYKGATANVKASRATGAEITSISSSPIADFKMLEAVKTIESAAGERQVIMINEEHRMPAHRAVTLRLLSRLYAKGFRYFAAETLLEADIELNKRGYPVQGSGFYTADPIYGEMIREALRLGFKVVPYEQPTAEITECFQKQNSQQFCQNERERVQAQNLYDRILKNDPQAKILVHVGRGHNSKSGDEKYSYMAKYFQGITGINPFTIDQTLYSERYDPAYEEPLYRFLTKNNMLRQPSVFQSQNKRFYSQNPGYDAMIFHPRVTYKNGRAAFLQTDLKRKAVKIDLKEFGFKSASRGFNQNEPVLIQALYKRESANAVPVDQVVIYSGKEIPSLMLPAGEFRIRAMSKDGSIIGQYEKK